MREAALTSTFAFNEVAAISVVAFLANKYPSVCASVIAALATLVVPVTFAVLPLIAI